MKLRLVFATAIISMPGSVRYSNYICTIVQRQLNLWDQGRYAAHMYDMVTADGGVGGVNQPQASPEAWGESAAQAFNCKILTGCLRQLVRRATVMEGGRFLTHYVVCTNTGCPVKDIIQ